MMTVTATSSVSAILADVPSKFRGPGGCVSVVKDGEVVGQKAWGYADLHRRIPMTTDTILPICSISKQMLCGLLTDLEQNPTQVMRDRNEEPAKQLSDQLKKLLHPNLVGEGGVTMRLLCNNQSGIRDYWAMTVLWGAKPEGHFSIGANGPDMIARLKSFHFQPGTEYSYANTNFFIVARCIEQVTGQPLGQLLSERIFKPAGMKTARLCAHTAEHPGPCVGYEGDEAYGFYPGINCVEWAGDAGIVASVEDMSAYEQFVDRSSQGQESSQGWYKHNSEQQKYNDGTPADYGFGLGRRPVGGVTTIGHAGALRGYRLYRAYAPDARVSVVALLNQEYGDPVGVADYVMKRVMGLPETDPAKKEVAVPGPDWIGTYLDPDTGLAITVTKGAEGEILVKYHRKADKLRVIEAYKAQSEGMIASLDGTTLHLRIPADNRTIQAERVANVKAASTSSELQGKYRCAEIDSVLQCAGSGDMVYGMFDGFLGQGPVHMMRSIGEDVWALACPRAMDSTPPGDWTVIVRRNAEGQIAGLTIGCWLARKLEYVRQ